MKIMYKRIVSILASLTLIVMAVVAFNSPAFVEAVDNLVLLEKRHPGYWDFLSPYKMIEVQAMPVFSELSTEEIKQGNVLNDLYQGNYSGVKITYRDGETHLEGTAVEEIWPGIAKPSELTTGTYFISAGGLADNHPTVYFEGFKAGKQHTFAVLDKPAIVFIDNSQFDGYKFTIHIYKDEPVDFSIYPIVYKLSEERMDTDEEIDVQTYAVWKDVPIDLTVKDKKLFIRGLNRFVSNEKEIVLYENGESKVYQGGNLTDRHAILNSIGFIEIN